MSRMLAIQVMDSILANVIEAVLLKQAFRNLILDLACFPGVSCENYLGLSMLSNERKPHFQFTGHIDVLKHTAHG